MEPGPQRRFTPPPDQEMEDMDFDLGDRRKAEMDGMGQRGDIWTDPWQRLEFNQSTIMRTHCLPRNSD